MLFNSHVFILLFLPITLLVFYWLGARFGARVCRVWLVAASLFYYAWWNPAYLAILIGSLLINYGIGFMLTSTPDGKLKKQVLFGGITINLAALGYYKYANWFIDNANVLTGNNWTLEKIILPLGISFFTFQQIAFLCDAAKGETREYRFLDYALFVTFFPQLIAGPIVHHKEMMPQFARDDTYRPRWDNISIGLTLFTLGLFKKVILADGIAGFSTSVFGAAQAGAQPGMLDAWSAALAYTFQIYFDFSGYSDMALGLARLFGIKLPMNFFSPYKATSIIDFWRRWHITLSRFLRDYLYIPLGGNRRGKTRRYLNLMITMLLGGLWHGAGWTFVIWGGLHGLYLSFNHAWRAIVKQHEEPQHGPIRWICILFTLFWVVIAWVFFRAEQLDAALFMLQGMFGLTPLPEGATSSLVINPAMVWVYLAILAAIAWFLPNGLQILNRHEPCYEVREEKDAELPRWQGWLRWHPNRLWAIGMAFALAYCILSLSRVSEFLYFQF